MPGLNETIAALRRRQNSYAPKSPSRMREVPHFGTNPGALRALFYAADIAPNRMPLVVVLHGCTQNAEDYAERGGWLALADRYGFAVLAPEQTRANNPNLCFNWFQAGDIERGQGEAASIAQMVRHVTEWQSLDPQRVFITGLSAGGAMSAVLLATYPELFAAGAVIAGLPYGAATTMPAAFTAMSQIPHRSGEDWGDRVRAASPHAGPWPRISIWHGDADTTVRPGAGEALVRQWTNVHGIEHQRADGEDHDHRSQRRWASSSGETLVEYHVVRGMGHGAPLSASGPDACGSAAPYMLDIGISSSLECAREWGLADGEWRGSRPQVSRPTTLPMPTPSRPSAKTGVDINAIITSALRSAGLMKG